MTFLQKWKTAVLLTVAGVLMFAGGAAAQSVAVTPIGPLTLAVGATTGTTLTAVPTGFTTPTYAWYSATAPTEPDLTGVTDETGLTGAGYTAIASATSETYDINVTSAKAKTFYVVTASEASDFAVSNAVEVTVSAVGVAVTPAGPLTLAVGATTDKTLSATPTGLTSPSYAWYSVTTVSAPSLTGVTDAAGLITAGYAAISGATAATYELDVASAKAKTFYVVAATATEGFKVSNAVEVTVASTTTSLGISINGATPNDNKLTSGAGGATNVINAAIIQYEGNINQRLNVSASIVGLASGSTFTADTGFRYSWFLTTADNEAGIVYSGNSQNTNMVKSTRTAADGGLFFTLPENLTANEDSDQNYKYFVRVEAPSLGTQTAPVQKISAFVTVTVKPRPVITIDVQPLGYSGSSGARAALEESSISGASLSLTASVSPSVTLAGYTAALAYQWSWVANAAGTGGGSLGSSGNSDTYTIPTTLKAGVYYYKCEVNYVLTPNAGGAGTNLSIPVRSSVVRVDVNPPSTGTDELIPATATINIPDVTPLTYDVPTVVSPTSNTGTKMAVTLPTTGIVTGMPPVSGSAYSWSIAQIDYNKILKSDGTPYSGTVHNTTYTTLGSQNKAHGVNNAGTYEVLVKVTGSLTATGATTPTKTYVGWKKVLLTVNPKNLTSLAANTGFSVKAPAQDSVYNGLKKTPLVTLKDGSDLEPGKDFFVQEPTNQKTWIDAGTASVTVKGCADNSTAACGSAGDANYIGEREGTFTIRRLPLTINSTLTTVDSKPYDGTDTVAERSIAIEFTPAIASLPDRLVQGFDFVVSGAKFDNKDVGTRTVNNITVKLDETNSLFAKNYTFGAVNAAANLTATTTKSGVAITKRDINGDATIKSMLSYTIPKTHRYNGLARGIGTVAWKSNVTNPNQAAFEIFYAKTKLGDAPVVGAPSSELPKGDEGESTTNAGVTTWTHAPGSRAVEYAVSVSVRGGSNFNDGTIYLNGTDDVYKIDERAKLASITTRPTRKESSVTGFINGATEDTTVFVGMSLSLKVTPVRPDSAYIDKVGSPAGAKDSSLKYKGGTFAYQWYKVDIDASIDGSAGKWDTLKTASAKTDTYSLPLPLKETSGTDREFYQVRVIWTYPAVTVPDTQFITNSSNVNEAIRVKIGPEPVSLANAEVSVTGTFPYTGVIYSRVGNSDAALNQGSSTVTVTINNVALTSDDYTFVSYGLNAGIGAGTVTVTGKNAYKGTIIGYFDIDQITTDETYLVFSSTKQYNDSIQEFTVAPRSPYSGLGKVNRVYLTPKAGGEAGEYDTLTGAPKAVGSYMVSVTIEEGINFTAMDEFTKEFKIVKRVLTKNDFIYDVFPDTQAWTGDPLPLITATLKPSVTGYTNGYKLVILQGNTESELIEMPTDEGAYPIYISVEGDENFATAMIQLGTYVIADESWVGVKAANRVIPATPAAKVVSVAPVKVAPAATFTAGPSPVSKASGKIAFFSTKSVKSGSLYIFDASGNAVAKLSAKAGTGEIASWNLKDKKGVVVAEGTYVVKGALAGKDGTREKVSFVFSVVK